MTSPATWQDYVKEHGPEPVDTTQLDAVLRGFVQALQDRFRALDARLDQLEASLAQLQKREAHEFFDVEGPIH